MSTQTISALPETGVWSIDPVHSTATFSVRHHAVATYRGRFAALQGSFDAVAGRLAGEVRVDALDLPGAERLRDHLLTPAFFDAHTHPTLTFRSDSIDAIGDGRLAVAGELTMRGSTHPVNATGFVRGPATVRHGDGHVSERLGIDLCTTVDRRPFGINFNTEIAQGILNLGWDVTIDVSLELVGASITS